MPVPVIHGICEEASPCDPKRKDLMQKKSGQRQFQCLLPWKPEDGLRRGVIMVVITKKFGLGHAEQKVHMSWA